jgi:hypothetical protein
MVDEVESCEAQTMRFRGVATSICSRFMFIVLISTLLFNLSLAVRPASRDLILPLQLSRQANTTSPIMDVFQVSPPVNVPAGATSQCNKTLMVYSFGQSYGKPFVGEWLCDCDISLSSLARERAYIAHGSAKKTF